MKSFSLPDDQGVFDFVVIGSGLGGLVSACILAKQGYSVAVLEKNYQIGGLLQVYGRQKSIYDTGIHYVGGLSSGNNLFQYFKYLEIADLLKFKPLNPKRFDVIRFEDGSEYSVAQGIEEYEKNLVSYFPNERGAILRYCSKLRDTVKRFPLFNLEVGLDNYHLDEELLSMRTYDYICSLTENTRLQQVLFGANMLYAGIKPETPFYIHALTISSYLTGAYRFTDGGDQIARALAKVIRSYGGKIIRRAEVVSAEYESNGLIRNVVLADGKKVFGKQFISNAHPKMTIRIFGKERFPKPFVRRVIGLESTKSAFVVHMKMKAGTFPYLDHNIYQVAESNSWADDPSESPSWPNTVFICTPHCSRTFPYADTLTAMTYMDISDVSRWAESCNTKGLRGSRGKDYEQYKLSKQRQVIDRLSSIFAQLEDCIDQVHSSTPLTIRDYTGDVDGSLYGILKKASAALQTTLTPRTKIMNLHMTGQSIGMHGVLGVTIGAFSTCFAFIDKDEVMKKVRVN